VAGPRAVTEGRTSIRTVASLTPASYNKLHRLAETMGVSISGCVDWLVDKEQVDDDGRSLCASPRDGEALRLAI